VTKKNTILPIPFNKANIQGEEISNILKAIDNGHISGDGPYTRECSSFLEKMLGIKKILLTPSCTHALEMSALLIDIKPGDEIIVPSFTFVSSVNSFALFGAKPVFVDIRSDTLNIDESLIEASISPRTKAIVPVHYAGIGCEMDNITEIANKHCLTIIEDNAHGLFGKIKDRYLGTFGQMASLSFHETKNFSCGEGGALMINDEHYIERAEIIREKGTDRKRFFQGNVDKYTWQDIGSSYLLSDILAAFLLAQLESKDKILNKRKKIWNNYYDLLKEWAELWGVKLPYVPRTVCNPYHLFYIILPRSEDRDKMIAYLRENKIHAVFHYLPLNESKMGKSIGINRRGCPITKDVSRRLIRLPFFTNLEWNDQDRIIQTIKKFY